MPTRKYQFAPGEYYHVYNRGNSKQAIFHEKSDYFRFLKLLFLSNGSQNFKLSFLENDIYDFDRGNTLVNIGAYCLMANHFHILLSQPKNGNISKFMQKLTTGYSMYYNNKYSRTGTLFEGRFKSQHVNDDRHLKYLFSYIHLNPVKIIDSKWKERGLANLMGATNFLKKYQFSSYIDYIENYRPELVIINKEAFPDYFSNEEVFKNEIFNWLTHYRSDL